MKFQPPSNVYQVLIGPLIVFFLLASTNFF